MIVFAGKVHRGGPTKGEEVLSQNYGIRKVFR